MQRALASLTERPFDVLVIGGGAFGAAAAWDATLRGLRTALIDRADFGAGASAECFKMVHGGIRYLQHGHIWRLRASCRERSALLRIAPHLVRPLPILVPTFGHGRRGKALLGAGMRVYDLLTPGRNAGISHSSRRIPGTRFLNRGEVLDLFPELEQPSLTGAAVFADGQMYSAPRLVLAFIKSAARAGATVANYVEATRFLWHGKAVRGVRARDELTGGEFDIQAELVLNAAGPWAEYLLSDADRFGPHQRGYFSRDAYFVTRRAPRSSYALAVPGHSRDRDTLVSRAARHLFVVPWRDYSLMGVWHRPFTLRPDAAVVNEDELQSWIAEMNAAHPAMKLRREEVCYACCGLVPFGANSGAVEALSFGKESRFIDHRRTHGVTGLVTLIGIRYTTARGDAAVALDLLLQQRAGPAPRPAPTERQPLAGGDIADFDELRKNASRVRPRAVSARSLDSLLSNHGTEAESLLTLAQQEREAQCLGHSDTIMAEVSHAINAEMAMRLEDVVFRRTDLGSGAHPGRAALEQAANRFVQLAGWSEQHRQREVESTEAALRRHHASEPADLTIPSQVRALR